MTTKALITQQTREITARTAPGEPLRFDVAVTIWLTSMANRSPRMLALYRQSVDHFAS